MSGYHRAGCEDCCPGGIPELIDCGLLPTSVAVSWSGGFELEYVNCGGEGDVCLLGTAAAPTSLSFVATLSGCSYCCTEEEITDATLAAEDCGTGDPIDTVVFRHLLSVSPPIANFGGPHAGYWTVTVSLSIVDYTSGAAAAAAWVGNSLGCFIWSGESVTFVGPLISAVPTGTYTAVSGQTFSGTAFPCDCVNVLTDTPGSLTVS